jgi:DNA polymerase III alpha subunit
MNSNQYGELIYSEDDICDVVMSGRSINDLVEVTVDSTVDLEKLLDCAVDAPSIKTWRCAQESQLTVEEFDQRQQQQWFMPEQYQQLDIAEYTLGLCTTPEQLQRVGEELLLYQDRGLFDLLRYLKYLVDTMRDNNVIWGVGRGSSVASYVLYLLEVHRIDSMFYDLDPREFLR